MIPFVLSPLRDNALDGPASGSAIGRTLMGTVFALSVTDRVESVFFLPALACSRVSLC